MSNGEKFAVQLEAFKNKALTDTNRVKRGVALRLFKAVIMDTPVLTGRLRANWLCSLNYPRRGVGLRGTDKTGGATIKEVGDRIGTSQLKDTIILTNSLPYVYRVEYEGWSHTKAPRGMVRINVLRFEALLGSQLSKNTFTEGLTTDS